MKKESENKIRSSIRNFILFRIGSMLAAESAIRWQVNSKSEDARIIIHELDILYQSLLRLRNYVRRTKYNNLIEKR